MQATEQAAAPAAATPAAPATRGTAAIMLTDPRPDRNGAPIKRVDYIRELWATGAYTRSDLAKHISEVQGVAVPYQIIFAATKDLPGGAVRKPGQAAPATAAATATPEQQAANAHLDAEDGDFNGDEDESGEE